MLFNRLTKMLLVIALSIGLLFLLIVPPACTHQDQQEGEYPGIASSVKFDGKIALNTSRVDNSPEFGTAIYIVVVNKSNNDIEFPTDLNCKIFTRDSNQKWIGVENLTYYYPPNEKIILKSNTALLDTGLISMSPDLSKLHSPITLRVVVFGNVLSSGLEPIQQTGAFIDVLVK